ncbi:unnamed protein product [Orchesella dallaii]|uniref:Uncharacterized protein n=1 Tax=Orchesella dallaii TaxID=48710 RepID=A0ABP1RBW4_9HEXA
MSCKSIIVPFDYNSPGRGTIEGIKRQWTKLHSNLNGRHIDVPQVLDDQPNLRDFKSCIVLKTRIEPLICSLIQVSKKLNFTIYSQDDRFKNRTPKWEFGSSYIYYNILIGNVNRDAFHLTHYDWLPFAVSITPYFFIVVLDNVPVNFRTILQPLDLSTGVSVLITVVSISGIFTFVSETKTLENLLRIFLFTIGMLFDQPAKISISAKILTHHFQRLTVFSLWLMWAIASLQISQLYKGTIFSYLSKDSTPSFPKSLRELIQSEIHVATMESSVLRFNDTFYQTNSLFKEYVLAELLNSVHETSKELSLDLNFLYKHIQWIQQNSFDFMHQYVLNGSNLPDKVALLDQQEYVETMQLYMSTFSKSWVSPANPLPVFMRRTFWTIYRNYFTPSFTLCLSMIYESGVYQRWESYNNLILREHNGNVLFQTITKSNKSHRLNNVNGRRSINYLLYKENGEKTTDHSKPGLIPTKFETCNVFLYPHYLIGYLVRDQIAYTEYLGFPTFTWLLVQIHTGNIKHIIEFYDTAAGFRFQTIFMGIKDSHELHLICISCKSIIVPYDYNSPGLGTIEGIKQQWAKLHSNLNGRYIHISQLVDHKIHLRRFKSCIVSKNSIDPRICALIHTSKKLNFTIYSQDDRSKNSTTKWKVGRSYIYYNVLIGNVNRDVLHLTHYDWLPFAVSITPYFFIVVLDNVPVNFRTILQPLDLSTGVSVLITVVSISGIFTFISETKTFENLLRIFLFIIGMLLDQPSKISISTKILTHYFQRLTVVSLWLMWAIASLQISQLYKGTIFSYLSKDSTPSFPKTLRQLMQSQLYTTTMEGTLYRLNETFDQGDSLFKQYVLAELLNSVHETSKELSLDLNSLYKNIHWIQQDAFDFMHQYVLNGSNLPEKFAYLDQQEYVETMQLYLSTFSKSWVSLANPLPVFMRRTFWSIYRNYFAPSVTLCLSTIYESGMYQRWESYNNLDLREHNVKVLFETITKSNKSHLLRNVEGRRPINYLLYKENGGKTNDHSKPGLIPTKFETCRVFLYPHYLIGYLVRDQIAYTEYLGVPTFTWLLVQIYAENIKHIIEFYNTAAGNRFQTIFMGIKDSHELHIICISCKSIIVPFDYNSPGHRTIEGIKQQWTKLHSNLNGRYMHVPQVINDQPNLRDFKSCIVLKNSIEPRICALIHVIKKLNFTIYSQDDRSKNRMRKWEFGSSYIYYNILIGSVNRDVLPLTQYEWLPFAVSITPYYFIVVLDNVPGNFRTILQPMDLSTGVSVLITVISISGIFTFVSETKTFENWLRIFLFTIGMLFDQPSKISISTKIPAHHFQRLTVFSLWLMWAITSLQISQLYKGTIFSYLSKDSTPSFPKSLKELIQSEIHVATMESSVRRLNETFYQTDSLFKEYVLSGLMNSVEETSLDLLSSELNSLSKNIQWIQQNSFDFMHQYVLNGSNSPDKFAFLDQQEYVQTMQLYMSTFSKSWVSPANPLPVFMRRTFWTIYRNYFAPSFTHCISMIYESGVYQRWETYYNLVFRENNVNALFQTITKSNKSYLLRNVKGRRSINYLLYKENGGKLFEMKFIPKTVYKHVSLTCAILILISIVVFLVESKITHAALNK